VGGSGNDTLNGGSAKEAIYGFDGDDTLNANAGNDTLTGGAGTDALNGGSGNDTYVFNSSDGSDTVYDTGGTDTIQLGAGLTAANVIFNVSTSGNDLLISDGVSGDQIKLVNQYVGTSYQIETLIYGDGTTISLTSGLPIVGGTGNDTLNGGSAKEAIYGFDGNDTLNGGAGNDTLVGGAGNDTFIFRSGFGLDAVADFTAGSGSDDVIEIANDVFADFASVLAAATQVGTDTVITHDSSNVLTLKNVALANLHQDDFQFIAA
ncbi:calcium-binding protein, partial [Mesorhizobium sp. LjNodule214]|uniref:calcium-binding protein n=1 Tax=Mesorhizobium sp. LjNodule214 TaxID=3342252 RepID=UPI003F50A723